MNEEEILALKFEVQEIKAAATKTQETLDGLVPQIQEMLASYKEWRRRVDDDRIEFKRELAEIREQNKNRDRILYGIVGGLAVLQVLMKFVIH